MLTSVAVTVYTEVPTVASWLTLTVASRLVNTGAVPGTRGDNYSIHEEPCSVIQTGSRLN